MGCYEFKSNNEGCYTFRSNLIEDCYTFISNINIQDDDPVIDDPEKPPFTMKKIPYLPRPEDVDTTRMYMDGVWSDGTYIYMLYRWFDDDGLTEKPRGVYLSRFTYTSSLMGGVVTIDDEWNTFEGDLSILPSAEGSVSMYGYSSSGSDSSGYFLFDNSLYGDRPILQTPFLSEAYTVEEKGYETIGWYTETIIGSSDISPTYESVTGCTIDPSSNSTVHSYIRGTNVNTGEIETVFDYANTCAYPLEDGTYVRTMATHAVNGDIFLSGQGVMKIFEKDIIGRLRSDIDDLTTSCQNINSGWWIPHSMNEYNMFIITEEFLVMGKPIPNEYSWELFVLDLTIGEDESEFFPIEREAKQIEGVQAHSFTVFQDNIIYTVHTSDEDRPEGEKRLSTYLHQVNISGLLDGT